MHSSNPISLQILMLADKNGSFVRLLGVDLDPPDGPGPKSQR